jgi:hypothetical protein
MVAGLVGGMASSPLLGGWTARRFVPPPPPTGPLSLLSAPGPYAYFFAHMHGSITNFFLPFGTSHSYSLRL